MQFKIDENLPIEVAEMLRSAGHDALTVPEQRMKGWMDPRIAGVTALFLIGAASGDNKPPTQTVCAGKLTAGAPK